MKKMNHDIKNEWVTALRSDKYRQIQGQLRDNLKGKHVGYCCLGVLCEITKQETDGEWDQYNSVCFKIGNKSEGYTPPRKVLNHAGLTEAHVETLIGMNDDAKCTFKQIANFIDNNL